MSDEVSADGYAHSASPAEWPTFKMQFDFEVTDSEQARAPVFWHWFRVHGRRIFPRSLPQFRGIADLFLRRRSMTVIRDVNLTGASIVRASE